MEPKRVASFGKSFKIPRKVQKLGPAKEVAYRSGKWNEGPHDYIHDHGKGVNVYIPDSYGDYEVPSKFYSVKALSLIGKALMVSFYDKEEDATVTGEYPENSSAKLYTTPDGKCLLIVNRGRVEVMIWGGNLSVTWRGIVN